MRTMWWIVGALMIVIVAMAAIFFAKPALAPTTGTGSKQNGPLHDRVKATSPKAGATVNSPIAVIGEAPGNWFFEASFPIQVRDKDGNVIGRTHASALSNWMTTEQVPFSASVIIDTTYTGPATLILMKDNPSGMPENDDAVEIPIVVRWQ